MKIPMMCPVCETQLELDRFNGDDGFLHEAYGKCGICGYSYNYSYGYTSHFVDGEEFFYSWDSSDEYCSDVMSKFYAAIAKAIKAHAWEERTWK